MPFRFSAHSCRRQLAAACWRHACQMLPHIFRQPYAAADADYAAASSLSVEALRCRSPPDADFSLSCMPGCRRGADASLITPHFAAAFLRYDFITPLFFFFFFADCHAAADISLLLLFFFFS